MATSVIARDTPQHPGASRFSVGRVRRKVQKVFQEITRRHLRRRVACTEPSPCANQDISFSPHSLICHRDLLMAICSSKSLNLAAGEALPWIFHDDGTLTTPDKRLLLCQFPGCRLIERRESDHFFKTNAQTFSSLAEGRQKHVFLLKLADLAVFGRRDRILYVDSDILFFKRPDALLGIAQSGNGNHFSKDIKTAYIANVELLQQLTGIKPVERLNAGLSVLNRNDIALDKIASALSKLDIKMQHHWCEYSHLIEQTLAAILATASDSGVAHLPQEYDLRLDRGIDGDVVARHYVGVIRRFFELEGLRTLISKMDFINRWQRFAKRGSAVRSWSGT